MSARWFVKKASRVGVTLASSLLPKDERVVRVLTYHRFGHIPKDQHHATDHATGRSNGCAAVINRMLVAITRNQNGMIRETDNHSFTQYPCHRALDFFARIGIDDLEHRITVHAQRMSQ